MAEPIVRKFVIDTGESEQNLKELNTQINATSSSVTQGAASLNQVAAAEDNVAASSKSLKAQLRDLQAQLANVDPGTEKYAQLSKEAGILKDKIQDAAQAVGTQAGSAFEKVGGSLGLVTSRISNLDFEGAAEGAKLLAQNITQIKPGDIANGIKNIGSAFASVGKALLTNPIFLIGAAIAAAIVYSEELLSLIDGVSDADAKLLENQKEKAAFAKKEFDDISKIENSLRLQGKTEREILDIKIAKVGEAIVEQKAIIETLRLQKQQQVEAAERNKAILKGLIEFISAPLTVLLKGVDLVTAGLQKAGFISDETFASIGNLSDKFSTSIAELVFNPAEVSKEGDKAIAAAEDSLKDLESQRDGFLLNIKDMEKKAADDRSTARQKELEEEQKLAQQIFEIRRKNAELSAAISKKILEDSKKSIETPAPKLTDFDAMINEQRQLQELQIQLMQEGTDKEIAIADLKYKKMRDAAQGNAEQLKIIAQLAANEVAAIEEEAARKRKANEDAVQNAKLQATSDVLGAINGLVSAFAKGDEKRAKAAFKIQKAVSIAQATVDTYKGANAIFASAAANPATVLFPAQPFIAAGVAIAAGLANVATIAQQQFQGGTSPGANNETPPNLPGDTGGGSQPAQFNPLAASFLQQRQEQITPRAYVLAGDVASAAEVRENVADLARIG